MKCPVCGGAELIPGVKTMPFVYKGNVLSLEAQGDICPKCNDIILSMEECVRIEGLEDDFRCVINAELVSPSFILNVRKKLHLDQRQAAELFGGGVNAFSRYELGKAKPPLSLVQLFRILDKQPELLNVLRMPTSQGSQNAQV